MASADKTKRDSRAHELEVKWRMSPTGDMSGDGDYMYYQKIMAEAGEEVAKKASQMASSGWKAEGGYGSAPGKYMYEKYYQAAKDDLVKSGAGRYENGAYVSQTAADKSHAAKAAANANKAYTDTAPTTGSLLSSFSGTVPTDAEMMKKAAKSGAGSSAAGGVAGRKKKTLLGMYFGDSAVLGG